MNIYTENGKTIIDGEGLEFTGEFSLTAENVVFRNFKVNHTNYTSLGAPNSLIENNYFNYVGSQDPVYGITLKSTNNGN